MLLSIENIVGCPGYFIDDQTFDIWSFKRYKEGRKIKMRKDRGGYLQFDIHNDGKSKTCKYHHIIVKMFIDLNYDSSTQQIDHINHIRDDNRIENLKVVSRSGNEMNKTAYRGKQAIYINNIGESIAVNAEHGIYYSKTFDKFYRLIEHTGKYRQLTESKHYAHMRIGYACNKKKYNINTTKFREELSK